MIDIFVILWLKALNLIESVLVEIMTICNLLQVIVADTAFPSFNAVAFIKDCGSF